MSILYTDDKGTFFDKTLLQYIKNGNNVAVMCNLLHIGLYIHDTHQLKDSKGRTLIHFAAAYGNTQLVKNLISAGADVNTQDHAKLIPLMRAVRNEHEETVKMLLQLNADIFMPDASGRCALGIALRIDRELTDIINVVKALLEKVTVDTLKNSKYVDSQVFIQDCPLYLFVEVYEDVEAMKFLLDRGSPVNARCPESGQTALHRAVKVQSLEMVKLLLEYNADVNAKDDEGYTPMTASYLEGYRYKNDVFKCLMDAGAILIDSHSGKSMMDSILENGTKEIVRFLLQSGIDLTNMRHHSRAPLHILATNKMENILEELRGYDFDVHLRSSCEQCTMLHYAASSANCSSVNFLLDHGADVNARDDENATPLCSLAFKPIFDDQYYDFHLKNNLRCVELLLERGADPQIFRKDHHDSFPERRYNFAEDRVLLPIFVKLALYEASGHTIETFTREQIQSRPRFLQLFHSVKLQLEQMKHFPISPHSSLTLYDFINAKDKISRFMRDKTLISDLTVAIREYYDIIGYYHRRLQKLYFKFNELAEWRAIALSIVSNIFSNRYNISVTNIVEIIVDYSLDEQWREIVSTLHF